MYIPVWILSNLLPEVLRTFGSSIRFAGKPNATGTMRWVVREMISRAKIRPAPMLMECQYGRYNAMRSV